MSGHALSRTLVHRRPVVARGRGAGRPAAGWLGWLAMMLRAIETRHRLAQMDDRMLKDIGITRSEALEEANRAPWDFGPRGW